MGKTKEEKEREKLEKQREKEKKKELKKLPKEERKLLEAEAVLEDPATPASKVIELLKKHWDQFNGEHSVRAVVKAMETHAQSPDVQYMGCNVLAILMGSGGSCEAGVQAVISQGGAAAAVRAFKTHKRERNVVRWAAAVLERTTAVGTEVAGRILSGGLTDGFGQSLVSALQLYGEDAEILGNCMRVLLHVSQVNSPATAKALADYQGLDVLVAVLAARPGAPDIALPACKVLADLTHTRTNTYGKRFCELGGVGAVVQAMKAAAGSGEQGRDVQFVATKVLSNVTNGNPWAQALMGSGEGFECVVGAMEAFPGDAEMQLWGASVFAHVDAAASPDAAQALYAAGGVDVLVAALRAHAAASLVQETACRALGNLALNSEERAAGVAGSGGMEAALASITGHKREASVVQAGCYALTSIAYACPTPECLGVVAPHTEMFVNMLKYYKDEQYIQEYGWNLLATLALNDPTATATAAGAAAAFGRAGGVEAVLAQINAHNGDVCLVENGVQLLATTLVTDENKVRAVASDGIRTVVLAMLKYPESEMVHFWGCIALGNIAACTARLVQEAVSRSTLALAVLRSMRTHRADPEVLSNASLALANAACTNAEARTAIVRSFGVETLLALMRQHAGDDSPALLANCCSALAALARGSEEVQARVSAYGGIADIVAALRAFRADDYAANMCVAALAAFTTNLYKLVECGGLDALIRTMLRHSTAAGAISISIAASSGTYALGIQILARLTYSSAASSNTMAFARSAGAGVITTETAAPQSVLCQRIAMAVAQMDGKKLDAGTQATGCTALAACCPIPPAEQATAVACGCVEAPVLAALIHIDNLAVQVRAWAALAAMASGEPACARAGQLLCVELAACVLHRCMGQQKQGQGQGQGQLLQQVVGAACRGLGVLLTYCEANRAHAATGLAGLVLGTIAEHPACRDVLEGGCQAIAGMLEGPGAFHAANDTVANGGVDILLSCVADAAAASSPAAARWGCTALARIAASSDENRELVAFAGAAGTIAAGALCAFPNYRDIQEAACTALYAILSTKGTAVADEKYCTTDVVSAVEAAVERWPDSAVVRRACALISPTPPPAPPRPKAKTTEAAATSTVTVTATTTTVTKQTRRRALGASVAMPAFGGPTVSSTATVTPMPVPASPQGNAGQGVGTLEDLSELDMDEVTMWLISLGVPTMKASGVVRRFGITGAKLARVVKKENLTQVGFDDGAAGAIFARLTDLARRGREKDKCKEGQEGEGEGEGAAAAAAPLVVSAAAAGTPNLDVRLGQVAPDFYEPLEESLTAAGVKGASAVLKHAKDTALRTDRQGLLAALGMSLEDAAAIAAFADDSAGTRNAVCKALGEATVAPGSRGLVLHVLAALRKLPLYAGGGGGRGAAAAAASPAPPPSPPPLYVTARGGEHTADMYRAQSVLTWPSIVLATADVCAAQEALAGCGKGGCLIEVHGAALRGHDAREFAPRSKGAGAEVLLEPGTTFRVLGAHADTSLGTSSSSAAAITRVTVEVVTATATTQPAGADIVSRFSATADKINNVRPRGSEAAAGTPADSTSTSTSTAQVPYQPLKVALIGAVGCDATGAVLRAYKAAVVDKPDAEAADVMSERQMTREEGAALYAYGNSAQCREAVDETLAGAGSSLTTHAALAYHVLGALRRLETFEDLPSLYAVAPQGSTLWKGAQAVGAEVLCPTPVLAYMDEDAAESEARKQKEQQQQVAVVEVQGKFVGYDVTPFLGDGREMVLLEPGQLYRTLSAAGGTGQATVMVRNAVRPLVAQDAVERFANSSPLPPNWVEKKDPATGLLSCYYNKVTKQSQHVRPKVYDPNFFA